MELMQQCQQLQNYQQQGHSQHLLLRVSFHCLSPFTFTLTVLTLSNYCNIRFCSMRSLILLLFNIVLQIYFLLLFSVAIFIIMLHIQRNMFYNIEYSLLKMYNGGELPSALLLCEQV